MKKRISNNGDFLVLGRYYLFNNLWGAATGEGDQCVWRTADDDANIAWRTDWNWHGPDDTIKSYAAVVLGWHWGWRIVDTGLPVQLSSIQSALAFWSFDIKHKTSGGMNVTYDIWLSGNPHHNAEDPTAEIMIWLHKTSNISPIGSRQTSAIINEKSWELWQGPHPASGWPVYSFVSVDNTCISSLDLSEFFRYLIPYGLSNSNYLLGVQAGVEVFTGEGRLDTRHYSVDIECL